MEILISHSQATPKRPNPYPQLHGSSLEVHTSNSKGPHRSVGLNIPDSTWQTDV